MSNICKSTFVNWVEYEQGEPYSVDIATVKAEGYQSTYLTMYNYIRDRGWVRENKKWISPHNGLPYKDVTSAYNSQHLKEVQDA